jgi:hypothetical protein
MSKKYLASVEKNILKMFEDAPESLDDAELNKLAELTEEISFVDKFEAPEGKTYTLFQENQLYSVDESNLSAFFILM